MGKFELFIFFLKLSWQLQFFKKIASLKQTVIKRNANMSLKDNDMKTINWAPTFGQNIHMYNIKVRPLLMLYKGGVDSLTLLIYIAMSFEDGT